MAKNYGCGLCAIDSRGNEFAVFPVHLDIASSAGMQTTDGSLVPTFWQGGEQVQNHLTLMVAAVALQQHLTDASGEAKVAVDLEGRMGVE